MANFRAIAFNEKNYTFVIHFNNFNWNGVKEAAEKRLAEVVANDPLHQKNGPWQIRNVDIGY